MGNFHRIPLSVIWAMSSKRFLGGGFLIMALSRSRHAFHVCKVRDSFLGWKKGAWTIFFCFILLTHIGRTGNSNPVMTWVVQTTGSVHPQPTLLAKLCVNTEPTISIGHG